MDSMISAFTQWIGFAPNIAAIVIIGMIGEVVKRLVLGDKTKRSAEDYKGFKRFYFVTYKAQAIILGALIGLIPGMPVPEAFQGDGFAGALLNYAGDGAASMVVYAALIGNAKSYVDHLKRRASAALGTEDEE